LTAALDRLAEGTFDIVVADLGLPDSQGIDTFMRIHARYPDMPVIVLSGMSDEDIAIKAVQKGAQDYFVKDIANGDMLIRSIRYSIERQKLMSQLEKSLHEIRTLKGLIPMCAWCKKIRGDQGYWEKVETYIEEHTEATFSHGICPECLARNFPGASGSTETEHAPLAEDKSILPEQRKEPHKVRVLLIEDNAGDAEFVHEIASEAKDIHIDIEDADLLTSGLKLLKERKFDLVISDLGLPDSEGIETFIKIHTLYPDIPIILMTGLEDEELAIRAVRSGAQDYIIKGIADKSILLKSVRYSIERNKLTLELCGRLSEIKRLEDERRNILSMFAHDIRNAVIPPALLLSEIISGKKQDIENDLPLIRDELTTAAHLLTNVIDFMHLETSGRELAKGPVGINAAILKGVDGLQSGADLKKIVISCCFPEGSSRFLNADGGMLQRVITNLIDNAIKYTEYGGKINITVRDMGTDILVQVMDTGVGIAEDQMLHIFKAFYRATPSQTGSGLGLYIARTIVEAHGGKIWVESIPGKGSVFSFTLPSFPGLP